MCPFSLRHLCSNGHIILWLRRPFFHYSCWCAGVQKMATFQPLHIVTTVSSTLLSKYFLSKLRAASFSPRKYFYCTLTKPRLSFEDNLKLPRYTFQLYCRHCRSHEEGHILQLDWRTKQNVSMRYHTLLEPRDQNFLDIRVHCLNSWKVPYVLSFFWYRLDSNDALLYCLKRACISNTGSHGFVSIIIQLWIHLQILIVVRNGIFITEQSIMVFPSSSRR